MTLSGPPNGIKAPPASACSPFELFHPDGKLRSVRVIGGSALSGAALADNSPAPAGVDLIFLSPLLSELVSLGWWKEARQTIARLLARDGLVYVFAPPILRLVLMYWLKRAGFEIWNVFLHLPDTMTNRYLIPLLSLPAAYGLSCLFPTRAWLRVPFLLLLRAPGGARLLSALIPQAGFVAYRKDARKPFAWTSSDPRLLSAPESVIVLSSQTGHSASWVIHCFSSQPQPAYIAKVLALIETASRQEREPSILRTLGPTVHRSGAAIPALLAESSVGGRQVLFESALSGRSAAVILADQPRRLSAVLDRLFEWLAGWNKITCAYQEVGEEEIEEAILSPARQLVPFLQQGKGYLDWLARSCSQMKKPLPRVTAHNDLTMWNILLSASSLGIVDWEEAQQGYFPLVDFYYAITDALLVSRRARSRQTACEAWLAPWGRFHTLARGFISRFQAALDIPEDYADLCLHVCFLRHSLNELKGSVPGAKLPFVLTLDWLSLHRSETRGWIHA